MSKSKMKMRLYRDRISGKIAAARLKENQVSSYYDSHPNERPNVNRKRSFDNRFVARSSFGVARSSFRVVGGFFLLLLAFSLYYAISPNDNGQIMYTRTFLEMIRDAPVLDMSWTNFRSDWLSGWDPNFLPGLYNFVSGLIGILQVVAVLCGGIAQLCMYVFYFLGWLF